ncbi:unnamed protein product [Bursaphelenchus xylophilus]|uniref:(pine wood nematode) hypothetical protein n=1 Tax=Bursaphelenchus xylophilus TaxID=6326 RepID=A0A1I7S0I4_BURXY|nr:unnamed protein product [Bursaphelenchus xylophilus]CAG9132269.1 unnamed protein product [Bursaphelenchus xylophilus]
MRLWTLSMLLAIFAAFETLGLIIFFSAIDFQSVSFVLGLSNLANIMLIIGSTRHFVWLQLFYCALQHVVSMFKGLVFGIGWIILNIIDFAGVNLKNEYFYPNIFVFHKGLAMGMGVFFIMEALFFQFHIAIVYRNCVILETINRHIAENRQRQAEIREIEEDRRTPNSFDTYYEDVR